MACGAVGSEFVIQREGVVMNIYRYVVQYDGGTAPRPFGDVCSLAICKPMIRRTASLGDWIIGVRSRRNNQVVYVMQVDEILPFDQYWSDSRFEDRRPSASLVPDNIYRTSASGTLVQVENIVHGASNIENDLSGRNVLLGRRFWYFGSSSPDLPDNLRHLKPYCRGHSVHINRRHGDVDIRELESWLESIPGGIHDLPIDATEKLRALLPNSKQSANGSSAKATRALGCTPRLTIGDSQISRPRKKCAR